MAISYHILLEWTQKLYEGGNKSNQPISYQTTKNKTETKAKHCQRAILGKLSYLHWQRITSTNL